MTQQLQPQEQVTASFIAFLGSIAPIVALGLVAFFVAMGVKFFKEK